MHQKGHPRCPRRNTRIGKGNFKLSNSAPKSNILITLQTATINKLQRLTAKSRACPFLRSANNRFTKERTKTGTKRWRKVTIGDLGQDEAAAATSPAGFRRCDIKSMPVYSKLPAHLTCPHTTINRPTTRDLTTTTTTTTDAGVGEVWAVWSSV